MLDVQKKGKIRLCLLSYSTQSMALPLTACHVPAYRGMALRNLLPWEGGRIPNTSAIHAKLLISLFGSFKIPPIPSAHLPVITLQYLLVYSAF